MDRHVFTPACFCKKKVFFTKTTKNYAFWSNGGKKYHMEDVGMFDLFQDTDFQGLV